MDKENQDFDVDSLMEMIEEMPEEDVVSSFVAQEEEAGAEILKEEREPVKAEPNHDAKLAYEAMNNNLLLQQENERLKAEKAEAETIAMQSVIRNFESQIDVANSDAGRLNQELIRARDEGDTAASVAIEGRLRENYDRIRDLKGKVEQYTPYLKQSKSAPQAEVQPGNTMAFEWLKENENWLRDERFSDKRQYADNLFKEMTGMGADMNRVGFWTKFEKNLAEYDFKKSQDKPQTRMPKNMVTYNSNGSNSNNPKKQSYKENPEFLQKVAFLAKNVIRNDEILSNKELLNNTLKQYHKVWKSGGFKHMPFNVQG